MESNFLKTKRKLNEKYRENVPDKIYQNVIKNGGFEKIKSNLAKEYKVSQIPYEDNRHIGVVVPFNFQKTSTVEVVGDITSVHEVYDVNNIDNNFRIKFYIVGYTKDNAAAGWGIARGTSSTSEKVFSVLSASDSFEFRTQINSNYKISATETNGTICELEYIKLAKMFYVTIGSSSVSFESGDGPFHFYMLNVLNTPLLFYPYISGNNIYLNNYGFDSNILLDNCEKNGGIISKINWKNYNNLRMIIKVNFTSTEKFYFYLARSTEDTIKRKNQAGLIILKIIFAFVFGEVVDGSVKSNDILKRDRLGLHFKEDENFGSFWIPSDSKNKIWGKGVSIYDKTETSSRYYIIEKDGYNLNIADYDQNTGKKWEGSSGSSIKVFEDLFLAFYSSDSTVEVLENPEFVNPDFYMKGDFPLELKQQDAIYPFKGEFFLNNNFTIYKNVKTYSIIDNNNLSNSLPFLFTLGNCKIDEDKNYNVLRLIGVNQKPIFRIFSEEGTCKVSSFSSELITSFNTRIINTVIFSVSGRKDIKKIEVKINDANFIIEWDQHCFIALEQSYSPQMFVPYVDKVDFNYSFLGARNRELKKKKGKWWLIDDNIISKTDKLSLSFRIFHLPDSNFRLVLFNDNQPDFDDLFNGDFTNYTSYPNIEFVNNTSWGVGSLDLSSALVYFNFRKDGNNFTMYNDTGSSTVTLSAKNIAIGFYAEEKVLIIP